MSEPLNPETPQTLPEPGQPSEEDYRKDHGLGAMIWISGLIAGLFAGLGVLGSLILWAIKKDDSEYIDRVGRAAINFNLSYLIWMLVSGILIFLLIGIILLPIVFILWLVFSIVGAIKANDGVADYKPFGTISFLK